MPALFRKLGMAGSLILMLAGYAHTAGLPAAAAPGGRAVLAHLADLTAVDQTTYKALLVGPTVTPGVTTCYGAGAARHRQCLHLCLILPPIAALHRGSGAAPTPMIFNIRPHPAPGAVYAPPDTQKVLLTTTAEEGCIVYDDEYHRSNRTLQARSPPKPPSRLPLLSLRALRAPLTDIRTVSHLHSHIPSEPP